MEKIKECANKLSGPMFKTGGSTSSSRFRCVTSIKSSHSHRHCRRPRKGPGHHDRQQERASHLTDIKPVIDFRPQMDAMLGGGVQSQSVSEGTCRRPAFALDRLTARSVRRVQVRQDAALPHPLRHDPAPRRHGRRMRQGASSVLILSGSQGRGVAVLPIDAQVAYIDTEGTFRPDRIRAIADRFNMDAEAVLENIIVGRAANSEHRQARAFFSPDHGADERTSPT